MPLKAAPVLKYPGSKWTLAKWIIEHMPPHTTYLEPFFGSGAVFFNKQPSKVETINDIDGSVVNLFKVIRNRSDELAALVEMTPWARDEYYASYEKTGDELEDARRFLIRTWQARSASTVGKTGWCNDVQGLSYTTYTKRWSKLLPERILQNAKRLKNAYIENENYLDLIKLHSCALIYADPPYPLSTRSGKMYAHEMTDSDHMELLEVLDAHPGPVLLSGYANEMYDERLKHWERETHKAIAEKGKHREEVLWINQVAARSTRTLFNLAGKNDERG